MKFAKYKDFDSFLEALLPSEQAICLRLRGLILGKRKEVAYISLLQESEIREDIFLEILHEAVLVDAERLSR